MRLSHILTRALPPLVAAAILTGLPSSAAGQPWSDNFDSYTVGGLAGKGNWETWDGLSNLDGEVAGTPSLSGARSAKILPSTDIVSQFSGATSGQWTMSGWCYIPTGSTGQQYFILLNQYKPGVEPKNWSLCLVFDSDTGRMSDAVNPRGPSIAIVLDQWVNVTVQIDLDADQTTVYYNDTFLTQKVWTEGSSGSGVVNIAALDLFSDGGSTIYWDDLALTVGITPVKRTTWGKVKTLFH